MHGMNIFTAAGHGTMREPLTIKETALTALRQAEKALDRQCRIKVDDATLDALISVRAAISAILHNE